MLSGVEQEVVVVELGRGLVVTLSIAEARVRLRPVASEAELRRVQKTLHEDSQSSEGSWAARVKEGQAKLLGGDLLSLRRSCATGCAVKQTPERVSRRRCPIASGGCICKHGNSSPERSARRADSNRLRRTPGSNNSSHRPSRLNSRNDEGGRGNSRCSPLARSSDSEAARGIRAGRVYAVDRRRVRTWNTTLVMIPGASRVRRLRR